MGTQLIENSLLENTMDEGQYSDPAESDFMRNIYENAIPSACNVGMCHGSIEDQLDVFTNCRQPLSMFSFFREQEAMDYHIPSEVEILPGAYAFPTYCEYCQAETTSQCPSCCSRPGFYFQKKRPPFAKRNPMKWDLKTDHVLDEPKYCDQMPVSGNSSQSSDNSSTSTPTAGPDATFNESYESTSKQQKWLW
mmetsp:Transcript_13024/g.17055  ORF Transcript_13024/g.17055 Transcript_13024/m.17055 type:complete len:193 (+) Transcript_13024:176-754(+)